jgi:hypothetical protein
MALLSFHFVKSIDEFKMMPPFAWDSMLEFLFSKKFLRINIIGRSLVDDVHVIKSIRIFYYDECLK